MLKTLNKIKKIEDELYIDTMVNNNIIVIHKSQRYTIYLIGSRYYAKCQNMQQCGIIPKSKK